MKNLLMLVTISLIALSGCAGKTVTAPAQILDMQNGLVDHRELTFNDKKKTMSSKLIETEELGINQHGLICVTPEWFNKGFAEWQKIKCK